MPNFRPYLFHPIQASCLLLRAKGLGAGAAALCLDEICVPSATRKYDQGPNGHWRIQKRPSSTAKWWESLWKLNPDTVWRCDLDHPGSPPPFVWLLWTNSLVSWCLVDSCCAKIIKQRSVETQMWILNGLPVKKKTFPCGPPVESCPEDTWLGQRWNSKKAVGVDLEKLWICDFGERLQKE